MQGRDAFVSIGEWLQLLGGRRCLFIENSQLQIQSTEQEIQSIENIKENFQVCVQSTVQGVQSTETVHVFISVPVSVDWPCLFSRLNCENLHSKSIYENEVQRTCFSVRANLLRIDFNK